MGGVNSSAKTTSEVQSKSENTAANASNVQTEAKATENKVETSKADNQTAKAGAVDQSKNSSEKQSASTQEINNKKNESLEKKADDSSLTIEKSTQLQNDQSDKVTEDTKKNEDSKDTTLNLQSAQPVAKSALKESKMADPAKQVTATLNIYDYDANDPKRTDDSNKGEGVAFSYTGKFNEGSIKDAIQAQIDADTQKQLAYKDQGTAIIPDRDGLPTEIGVSPVISAPFSDNDLGGYFFRDKTTNTYQQNNQTQLVDAYNKWRNYKKAHFALAGYKLADQDEQAINLDDLIEDGKTYNIYVNHQLSVVNVYHWTELKRTVEFKYYYKQDDKNAQAADSVTKNGYYNDGKFNQAQPKQFINATGEPVFSNLPKTSNTVNQTDISDANSFETRLLPDNLKTTKDQTKVLHDTINSRYIDLAVGLITDNQGQLDNYGKATPVYPSGTILFEGEPVKQIDNWHTFDPNVPDTGSDYIQDTNTYSTVQGSFNKGTGDNIDPVNNPATTTIYYYHDQPVDITFEDVTNGDANAPVLSNFTASKDLRVDLNSQYIPGKPHTTPKDKKNNKNQKYEAYSYQADDNTYDASAINVDPSGTLKSSKSLNYADVLKAYTDNGYALVSSDPDDLTYELEDVYDNNRNLQHKKRVVKLVHRAVAHTDTKTATRTIHYVANTKDGKQLQDDTTQNVTLTSSTYYTDAVTGHRVNAKQEANGDWIVDTTNTDSIPAITWTVDSAKSSGVSDNTQDFAAVTTPDIINLTSQEAASRKVDDGNWYLVDTDSNGQVSYGDPTSDTWKTDTPNKVADGYLIYKQKAQYNIHYIDVNGVDKTTYEPTDGKELKDHEVTGVGSEDKTYVGDTPDATQKLWSPADYEKAGYILVGLSDNAKGDLLGKQTLTKNVQDQYVYLKHQVVEVTPHTPDGDIPSDPKDPSKPSVDKNDLSKSYTRNIYYKAKTADGPTLKDQTTQKVTFEASVYVDKVTHETTGVETITDVNGKQVQVANGKQGKVTWNKTIIDGDATKLNDASARFNSVDQPTIDLEKGNKYTTSDDMTGTWYLVDGEANELDLTPDSSNPVDKTLVYKQKAQYNIHYIDVNGVDKTTYEPTDGKELKDHEVTGVGSEDKTYVGDTPDATQKLWSPADYEKAGYVLVGLSDNAKGDLLGKQTLTKNVQDQYVYLKHAVKTITPNTPAHDVPKDPDGNPIVDPSDLHKEFHRTIFYKANATDGQTLMDQTDQKTEFNGTIAYDVVTGKPTTPEAVKDVNGKDVQVATLKDGTITWNKQNDKFSAINQPTIELKKDDKYTTSEDMAGTWYLVDGEAGEVDLTPDSKNPDDKTLVYKQKAQYNIHYIDVNGVEGKNTYAPTDGRELTDHLVPNVGEGKGIFVGDTPDVTAKLWSPADYEKAGYVLVGLSDNAKGDLLGKQTLTHGVQDQYVYLKHAVKTITPNTPAHDVPKDPDGKRAVDPNDLHKEFTRNITFVANNDAKSPLKNAVSQKVEFDGHIYVDMVTGQTTTPETIKDANDKTIQVATTKAGNIEWNHDTQTMDGVIQQYITLDKNNKYATSDDMLGTWHWISGVANEITLKPTSDNPQDIELVYEKNKGESGPDESHDLPKVDVKQETKTFTRTVVYRGTKDGGKTYQKVNGSPDGTNIYKQTVTFTRNVFSTTDKAGKVTILEIDPWKTSDSMSKIDSKTPTEVGYEDVDKASVEGVQIDPNSEKTDLGITVVTYVATPVEETYHVTVHYVDEDGNVIKDPVKDSTDYKNGQSYDENSKKDSTIEHDGKTYVFTRVKEGDFPAGSINGKDVDVTYVYKLKEEPVTPPVEETYHVTVHYVDEDGNVIKDPVKDTTDYKNGQSYNENSKKESTIEHDGKTYVFTRVKEGDTPTGTIQGKDVDVTYVYKLKEEPVTPPVENTYHVTVHYVDEDGNVIKDPIKDSTDYKNGQSYDENSKKDSTIQHDGKTYVFTRVKEGDFPAGSIQGKDVDVTYVYKLKEEPVTPPVENTYHVTVHYVDEDGNVIKDPVKDSTDYKNSQSYDENSKKESTIEHDGETYVFTRVKEGDFPAGSIQGKDVDVTYVYKLKEAPVVPPVENTYHVTVHYVDEDGNVIKDPIKDSTDYKNGQSYDENSKKDSTIQHDGKTYVFTRVKEGDFPAGSINGKDVDVTYVYKLKEEPLTPPVENTYHVTVHYVDEDGNVIKDPIKDSTDYKNGQSYDENSKKESSIEHDGKTYVFTRVKEGDFPAGSIQSKDVDVTYVYKLKETPVTPIVPPIEETHTITVNFVDENGNVLQDSRKSSDHKNGTDYNESNHPTTITKDGKTYTYTRVEGDTPSGKINGKDVVITYVYKEVVPPVTPVEETYHVTVHYVDEDGNVIKNPVKDTTDYKNGQSYDENSKKESSIEYDGKTYVFTRVKEGADSTGTIEDKDIDVTYVYKLKETPITPVKPSEKTTSPAKDNDLQNSKTNTPAQKDSTTSVAKTLNNSASKVGHRSDTPSPTRQNKVTRAPSAKTTNKLPQTGKKDTSLASVLGLAALGAASVLTLFIDRKKKN